MNTLKDKQAVLKARAEKLAQLNVRDVVRSGIIELVEFILNNEHFAVESDFIKEVYPLKDFTSLPGVPPFVYGLITIRRRIVSVIDIRRLFDMPFDQESSAKTIILQNEEMEFGILAEEIIGLRRIHVDELQTNLPTLTGIRQEFLKGITADRLLVLDALKLLNSPNIIVRQKVEG